jgi:flagellar basal body-associated protein FliL
MAEKATKKEKEPEPAPAPAADHADGGKKGAGGLLAKTPVLLGLVMVIEAAVLFAGFKFLGGGPKNASAVELAHEEGGGHDGGGDGHGDPHGDGKGAAKGHDKDKSVELNVVDFKAPNTQNGRRYLYDVSVYVSIKGEHEAKVKDKIKDREALIKDRMRTIIGQMDPEKLGGGSEPGLETLRRQVKSQLEIIIGDGMIDEVLVPRCIPFRADF